MKIVIAYKNRTSDEFDEKQIDCSKLTIRGHTSKIVDAWATSKSFYAIDNYNAVNLEEVISIRVI